MSTFAWLLVIALAVVGLTWIALAIFAEQAEEPPDPEEEP